MLKLLYRLFLILLLVASSMLLYQKTNYGYHTLIAVDPAEHAAALIKQKKYAKLSEYLDYFTAFDDIKGNKRIEELRKIVIQKRTSLSYQSEKILEGIYKSTSDEPIGYASAIGSDFLCREIFGIWL